MQPQQQRPNFDALAMIPRVQSDPWTEADRVLFAVYQKLGPIDTTLADVLSEALESEYEAFVPVPSALMDPNLRGSAVLAACAQDIAEAIEQHHVLQDKIREDRKAADQAIKEGIGKALNG